MKPVKTFLVLAFIFVANSISAQSTFEKWPAIKEFHGVMSQTFHPAEEGNFAPIKSRSEEMMTKATLVVKSDIPAAFKTEAILAAAGKLETQSASLHQLVTSGAANEVIFKSLNNLHDTFHEIVGLCSDEKK
jgi:hypothetical protein